MTQLPPVQVLAAAERMFGSSIADICGTNKGTKSASRMPSAIRVREILTLVLRDHCGCSYPSIAALVFDNERGHSSALDTYKRAQGKHKKEVNALVREAKSRALNDSLILPAAPEPRTSRAYHAVITARHLHKEMAIAIELMDVVSVQRLCHDIECVCAFGGGARVPA